MVGIIRNHIRKREWIVGGVTAVAFLAISIGAVALTASGDDATPEAETRVLSSPSPTAGTATGEPLPCGDGASVGSYFNQVAAEFLVIGELADADGGHFTVIGPTGELAMTLAMDSDVEGSYVIGEPIEVGGRRLENGKLEATRVRPGCAVAVADASTGPSTDTPAATPSPLAATPTPIRIPARTPIIIPVFPGDPPAEPPPEPTDISTEVPTAPPTEAPTPEPTAAPTADPRPTRTPPPEQPTG